MRSLEEFKHGCAEMLVKFRLQAKLSRAKLSTLTGIDERKVKKYEEGTAAPTIPEFFAALDAIGVPALPLILEYIHPSEYSGNHSEPDEARRRVTHYMQTVATERMIHQLDYFLTGQHGSNIEPQMQLLTLINHLPLKYRIVISQTALCLWNISTIEGSTILPEDVQPDIDLLSSVLDKAEAAVKKQQQAYSSATNI